MPTHCNRQKGARWRVAICNDPLRCGALESEKNKA